MQVKEMLKLLIDMPMDAQISCININDARDELEDQSGFADVTSIVEVDDGQVGLYYIGDKPPIEEEED